MVIVLVSTPSEVCDQTMNNLKLTWKSFPSSPLHEQSIIPYILCSSYKLLLFKLPPTLMLPKSIQIKSECPCIPSGLGIFLWELNYEVGFWGALPRSISQWKRDPCSSTRRLPSTKTVLSVGHWAAPVMLLEVHSIAQWPHSNGNKGGAWNVLSIFTVPDFTLPGLGKLQCFSHKPTSQLLCICDLH